ncbi:Peptidase family M48 [Ruegeria halocynthiae]|uniref:Peptidase family M48 n=1 Tax=Ruegeria halocynthiae TaxID=985054 RepID=A0A1H2VLK0_9RHOB|nr:M48 family metallopeptidase [Ruegeria halocynthiae]SDW69157.1 Peptidase family M48 [Ruegeria halocynthiae]
MHRLALLLVLLLAACATHSMMVVPATQWQPKDPALQEKARVLRQVSRSVGEAAARECRRRLRSANCDFVILVDPSSKAPANAFLTLDEDGRPLIIFTQPMIASAQNAEEMAFVMGHEVAHHILGHIARQAENSRESARIFGELAREQGKDDAGVESAQALGAEVGAQNYTREFELEADRLGTKITHAAGYDPLVGMVFFQRIPDPGDRFLATHPPNAKRVEVVLQTARQLGLR